jgi:DNA-binding CsgD family transcriptional regulator
MARLRAVGAGPAAEPAAREDLREALELAWRCGATALAAQARAALVAAGARPRSPVRTGAQALTGAEARTARLAAAGASNREIAAELYLSLKTVEQHLTRAYRKLGVRGRADLAPALGDRPEGAGSRRT